MNFFKKINHVNFIHFSSYFFIISVLSLVIFIFIIFIKGINFGLDFNGGLQIEMKLRNVYNIDLLIKDFNNLGIKKFTLCKYGSDRELLLNVSNCKFEDKDNIIHIIINYFNINESTEKLEIRRSDYVGSVISDKLYDSGSFAIFLSMIGMMLYITFRFDYKFGICAVLALMHDIIFLLGIISIFNIEFTLILFASLLSVLGYSINDTVVIFDRIRENIYKFNKVKFEDLYHIINESINKTLSRTLMTSFTTLLVVIILMLFGGISLFDFSLILFLGIIVGTYSSIYIAPYCVYLFSKYNNINFKNVNIDDMP